MKEEGFKDKNNVYYKDFVIEGADPQTFEALVCGEKIDKLRSKGQKCSVEYRDKNYIYENFEIGDKKLKITKKIR